MNVMWMKFDLIHMHTNVDETSDVARRCISTIIVRECTHG